MGLEWGLPKLKIGRAAIECVMRKTGNAPTIGVDSTAVNHPFCHKRAKVNLHSMVLL
jgi:hypothetical protein